MITWRKRRHRKGKVFWDDKISAPLRNNTVLFCLAMSYWWELGNPAPGPEVYAEPELVGLGLEVHREVYRELNGRGKPSATWRMAAMRLKEGWKP